jgi:hypothetical protein
LGAGRAKAAELVASARSEHAAELTLAAHMF